MRRQLVVAMVVVGLMGVSRAQTTSGNAQAGPPRISLVPMPVQPGGTVTGHVYCADNQRPARFATVQLYRQADPPSASQTANRGPMYQPVGSARTALDGSFAVTGVPAGDYYVVGTMAGYISPVAVARMTQSPITGVPYTHVDVGRSADVVVSMTRGAVVSGRVVYDDGSPVPGVMVRLQSVASAGVVGFGGGLGFGGNLGTGQTDDRGVFRLSGLPVGSYNAVVTVQTEITGRGQPGRGGQGRVGPAPMLNVYAPAAMRKSDARVVEIHGGETLDGVDIQVALNGLRSVTGSVESKADGHMLNSGTVSLADAADPSLTRSATVETDGTYRLEYLPAGNYTLTVRGADRDQNAPENRGRQMDSTGKRYQSATQAVTVGDSDLRVDPVLLDEVKATSSTASTQ